MAVPKRRTSKAVKRKRRTHFKITLPGQSVCPNCQEVMRPHRMCASCGFYNGRMIKEIEKDN